MSEALATRDTHNPRLMRELCTLITSIVLSKLLLLGGAID